MELGKGKAHKTILLELHLKRFPLKAFSSIKLLEHTRHQCKPLFQYPPKFFATVHLSRIDRYTGKMDEGDSWPIRNAKKVTGAQ